MAAAQPLSGKVALITGASKGIGAATATILAALGAKVVINYSTDGRAADALVEKLGSAHALAVQADAGSVPAIEHLVHSTVAWAGKIDILVPNAGIALMKSVEQTSELDFQRTYDLNVKGPYFLVQKALPHMSRGSHVVLLSTSLCAVSTVQPHYLLYTSSKGAVEQMTRVLANQLGEQGITVNAVAPGPTATELFYNGKSDALVEMIAGSNPFKRLGTPDEIANAIAFLSGDGGSWVNGQILRVNGGMTVG